MNKDSRLKVEQQLRTLDAKITMFEYELDKLERDTQANLMSRLNRLREIRQAYKDELTLLEEKEGAAWIELNNEIEALVTELEDGLQEETTHRGHDLNSSNSD